jgi:uncharacterized protein YcbK (DUF882 family)
MMRLAPRLALALGLLVTPLVVGGPASAKKPARTSKAAPARKPAAGKRAAWQPRPVAASRAWHTPAPGRAVPLDARGKPRLVLFALNTQERVELTARDERGGFSAEDLERAAHLLRDPRSGNEHPMHPHLVDVAYRLQVRFAAQEIRVISGYRTPRGTRSNHGKGRALDIVVPGASDEDVAKFSRELGFTGVGVYPVSGFVHVDVRDRSFYWVDTSGPGRRSRLRSVLGKLAQENDARARQRGENPVEPFSLGSDVDAVRPPPPTTPDAQSEDSEAEHDALPSEE